MILFSVIMLVIATYILGWSSLFTVSAIEVNGSGTQITPGITLGQKLARVEPRAIAAKFENLDWVASAKVSRNWVNGKVTIDITERIPIARYNNMALDSTGKSFKLRGQPAANLLNIQAEDLEAATKAVTFFTTLPTDLKSILTVVKVLSAGDLVLEVNNAGKNLEIRWGIDGDNQLKQKVYQALITLPENAGIKRIDVSAPHAPIVQ